MSIESSDWTETSCYNSICDWTADGTSSPSMREIVQRYGEVAKSVNEREIKRFIAEIRQKWNPLPPAENEWEDGYRGEGWTDEGAFALCLFQQVAGNGQKPEPQGVLCEAEEKNEILLQPIQSLIQDIRHGPLSAPQPHDKIAASLTWLKTAIRQQVKETSPLEAIPFELPQDYTKLLHTTDYVGGADVPSETAYTYLVGGLEALPSNVGTMVSWEEWFPWERVLKDMQLKSFAAWKLGGCEQHRQIYYVLCRESNDVGAPAIWGIFDRDDVEMKLYLNLSDFLQHETLHIAARPGGHRQEQVLIYDTYPAYEW